MEVLAGQIPREWGIVEWMKAEDQIDWVQSMNSMNNTWNAAEEIVLRIVYG